MIDTVMQRIRNEIDRLYKDGRSYRDIAGRTPPVSYGTIENLHKGLTKKPEISTITAIARGLGLDIHGLAHEAFGLKPPEESNELTDMMKVLCGMVAELSEGDMAELAGYIKRMLDEGGGYQAEYG